MGGPAHINGIDYPEFDNFYVSPILVNFKLSDGIQRHLCKTVEHAFQACKTENKDEIEKVLNAKSPMKARDIGQKVTLRDNWEEVKVDVMRYLVGMKLALHPDILDKLLKTGDFGIYFHQSSAFWCNQNQKIWEYWRTYFRMSKTAWQRFCDSRYE